MTTSQTPGGNLRDTLRLNADQATAAFNPDWLSFETTDALPVLDAVFGQERAVRAIEFALGMDAPGYHLFASGPDGFGKQTIVTSFLRRRAQAAQPSLDWVYVHNFTRPDYPQAISLPPGHGLRFARAMEDAVAAAAREICAAFDSDDYVRRRQALAEAVDHERTTLLEGLQAHALELGFALQFGPAGIASAPLIDGKPITEEQFGALDEVERRKLQDQRGALEDAVQETLLKVRAVERTATERASATDEDVAAFAVDHLFQPLSEQYGQDVEVQEYLDAVRTDLRRERYRFRSEVTATVLPPGLSPLAQAITTRRYEVNTVVTNDPQRGAPVVTEPHPTYQNLIGLVEYQSQPGGGLATDHTMIRAGALMKANGGYLVLRLRDLLTNTLALDGLKRALTFGTVAIENMAETYGLMPTVGLRPEPVPLNLKVVLIGDAYLYSLLYRYDPDFRQLFRVKAEFEMDFPRTRENAQGLASVVRSECSRGGLLPFTKSAVGRLIEHSSRMVEDQRRLSANIAGFLDIVRQADYWARAENVHTVAASHVERAIEETVYRSALVRDRVMEAMNDGSIHVETTGARPGQINALSVYDLGDIAFGRPSRVTCVVSPGNGTVVMVERDSDMAGRIHNKGFLILRGLLADRFGQDRAAALHASMTFEQLYGDIDGDSASSTEMYVLLSALADAPIQQQIAVTGSVDQLGNIQPIGGATAKVEGFFDICRVRGLTGTQGVMLPRANVPHLMLRADVVEAIEAGQFHLWAIERIEEGIEILTGTPAGATRGADGKYPEGTIFRRVEDRLEAFARGRTPQPAGEPSRIVMPSPTSRPTPGIPPGPPPEPPVSV
ncbi:MAG: ATP-dependent protease [Chloroflexi bacterium]|nr:ATP-dependent protease [Chloroflexota bacterium]